MLLLLLLLLLLAAAAAACPSPLQIVLLGCTREEFRTNPACLALRAATVSCWDDASGARYGNLLQLDNNIVMVTICASQSNRVRHQCMHVQAVSQTGQQPCIGSGRILD